VSPREECVKVLLLSPDRVWYQADAFFTRSIIVRDDKSPSGAAHSWLAPRAGGR
jgi:hypothetical protein